MTPYSDSRIKEHFLTYPDSVRPRMLELREFIFDTADHLNLKDKVEESLKWGEPSYLAPAGSPIRIDWKPSKPDTCQFYFHCQTSLVTTFRRVYPFLDYDGNRAIVVSLLGEMSTDSISRCIELAFTYHELKHLPLLGCDVNDS